MFVEVWLGDYMGVRVCRTSWDSVCDPDTHTKGLNKEREFIIRVLLFHTTFTEPVVEPLQDGFIKKYQL